MINVIKRDGRIVEFKKDKIVKAIWSAACDVDRIISDETLKMANEVADNIETNIIEEELQEISVEEIQDMVEEELMNTERKDIAKAYILYRQQRTNLRHMNSDIIQKISNRIKVKDIENANANVDEKSFSGREKEGSADLNKFIALDLGGLSDDVAKAHKDMLIYQHDLEKAVFGIHNCLFLDFQTLFKNGFRTRNGDVREPASFSTADRKSVV